MDQDRAHIVHHWTLGAWHVVNKKYLLHERMLTTSAELSVHGLRLQLMHLMFRLICPTSAINILLLFLILT